MRSATNITWKAAAGLALTDEAFHPTVLTLWRNKLRASEAPQRIFDAVRAVVTESGVLAGKTRRALDLTVLDDAVARDVPEAPLPDPDSPAPPRFLPGLDNVFLSHHDRARIIDPDLRVAILKNEWSIQPVLIDGFIRAKWTTTRDRSGIVLAVEPYEPLSQPDVEAVTSEGARLLDLMAPGDTHEIRFVAKTPR